MKIRNPEEYKLDQKLPVQNPKTGNKLGVETKNVEQMALKNGDSEGSLADSVEGVAKGLEELQQEGQKAELANAMPKTGIAKETRTEEIVQTTQDSTETTEARKDSANLSKESQITGSERRWTPEEERLAWEEILAWFPIHGENVEDQMRKLMDLYMKLLEAILKNTCGDEQLAQLEKLDQVIVFHLDQLTKESLAELNDFFLSYGSSESINRLKRSLYHTITGRYLSSDSVKQNWKQVSLAGKDQTEKSPNGNGQMEKNQSGTNVLNRKHYSTNDRTSARISAVTFYSAKESDGKTLYGKSGKATSRGLFHDQNQIEPAERQLNLTRGMQKNLIRISSHESQNEIYTFRDIVKGEKFVSVIASKTGNLFENPAITSRNESITGLFWAINRCKTELFLSKEIPNSPLGKDLITAEEKMTASFLNQNKNSISSKGESFYQSEQVSEQQKSKESQKNLLQNKSHFQKEQAYDVYQYVMGEYHSGRPVNKAIRDGFYYALKYFFSEEQELGNKKRSGNQKAAENLTRKKEGILLRPDLQVDIREMEKNWERYIASMGYNEGTLNLRAQLYSPWGQTFNSESEPEERKIKKGETLTIFFGVGICIIIALLFFFFL